MMLFRNSLLFLAASAVLLAQAPGLSPAPKPAAPAFTPSVPADKVVISVGDEKLTAQQFNQLVEMLPEQSRTAARGEGRKQFADEIVRVLVLAQEGKRRKLDETASYQSQQHFQAENLLAGKAYNELGKVDEAEVRKYYDEHKNEFEQVHARHILIRAAGSPIPPDPGQKDLTEAEALAKAQDLRKKIVDGADFAKLASEESQDTGSKGNGGDLSFFHRGQMVPPFEQAAFNMKVGELSEPVRTPFGYHIIRVEAKNAGTFQEAKPEIERRLQPLKLQGVVEDLVKKTSVTVDADFFGAPAAAPKAPATPAPPAK